MSFFKNNSFEFKQGYEDGFKWGKYDYSTPHNKEYDAGFMAGYFQNTGRTFDGKTSSQLEEERKAQQYQNNSYYSNLLFGSSNPFSVQIVGLLKSIVVAVIIFLMVSIHSLFNKKEVKQPELKYSNQQEQSISKENVNELKYSPEAIKPEKKETEEISKEEAINQLNRYVRDVEKSILKNWTPPKQDTKYRIIVSFTINKQGQLIDYEIKKSSGNYNSDKAAIKALELTQPFKPLPEFYKKDSMAIEFTFDLNRA